MTDRPELTDRQLMIISYLIRHVLNSLKRDKILIDLIGGGGFDVSKSKEETIMTNELEELDELIGKYFFNEMDKEKATSKK